VRHSTRTPAHAGIVCNAIRSRVAGAHTIPYRITGVILALCLLSGCSSAAYYAQSAAGQLDLMMRARPIHELLADPATPPVLRQRLQRALQIRRFASARLGLPNNDSYTRYAALDRPYVVWNVFAAPALSTVPHRWCFAVVGCVAYRGYFEAVQAKGFADGLRARGLDAAVAGVPAYSTLGWFSDPLPSTVIDYPEERLAGLIFHELAHQVVYVRDDAAFNESFATVVEMEGARRWFAERGEPQAVARHERIKAAERRVARLALAYRERLQAVFETDATTAWRLARKRELFTSLRRDYLAMAAQDSALAGYEEWFDGVPNNARLVPFATYFRYVAAFEVLLKDHGGELPEFYAAVAALGAMPATERQARLAVLGARARGAQR